MENTYEEVVLQTVMKDILQGEQGAGAARERHRRPQLKVHREAETPGGGRSQALASLCLKFPLWFLALLRVISEGRSGCRLGFQA